VDSFKDKSGLEWTPLLECPALIDGCEACNITLDSFLSFSANLGSLVRMLWYSCRYQAKPRGIKQDEFFARLGLVETREAMKALLANVGEAFPEVAGVLEKVGGDAEDATPFDPGNSETSTNSQPSQESAHETE
jgi:hypothetical protein